MSGDVIEIGKMKEINVEEIKKKYAIHLSGKPIREALFFKEVAGNKGMEPDQDSGRSWNQSVRCQP